MTEYLSSDRYFDPDPHQKEVALCLYRQVAHLPLICPHGHVDPRLFADPNSTFGNPAELFIIPDHHIFRMLYSQGIPLEVLGIPRSDGGPVETDPRRIWQIFAEHFYLFRGTPTGIGLSQALCDVFGVNKKLTERSAQDIYDQIAACLALVEYRPRRLFERFNIEVLCTTNAATDTLEHHRAIRESGWPGRVLPTFRPDAVVNIETPGWRENIEALSQVSGIEINSYRSYISALENRRAYFKEMGAVATDHAMIIPYTEVLSPREAEDIFNQALKGKVNPNDATRFTGHMLMENARMSIEDGLVMQLHPGAYRNHNRLIFERFGPHKGADIPLPTDYTRNLQPLFNKYGNQPNFSLILFTLDETSYARELAPLAGHYPAVKLGPPWWFYDSWNGMRRYFDQVIETAGLYNTVGFNDDTRIFPSIPTRHDIWRRAAANWIAGLVVRGIVDDEDAEAMIYDAAYRLTKQSYHTGVFHLS